MKAQTKFDQIQKKVGEIKELNEKNDFDLKKLCVALGKVCEAHPECGGVEVDTCEKKVEFTIKEEDFTIDCDESTLDIKNGSEVWWASEVMIIYEILNTALPAVTKGEVEAAHGC